MQEHVLVSSTSKDFQTSYEGEFRCLYTVTFGKNCSKLNSRPVYCSRLYGNYLLLHTSFVTKNQATKTGVYWLFWLIIRKGNIQFWSIGHLVFGPPWWNEIENNTILSFPWNWHPYNKLFLIKSTKVGSTSPSSCLGCFIRNHLLCLQGQTNTKECPLQVCSQQMGPSWISLFYAKAHGMDPRRMYTRIFHWCRNI